MDVEKVHPSELLEFSTLPSQAQPSHVEFETIKPDGQPETSVRGISTPSEGPSSASASMHDLPQLNEEAQAAALSEHRMTFVQGLRMYPKAIGWSAVISMAIVMEGYDTALINGFFAFEEFQKAYGIELPNGTYQITTEWQAALNNASAAGAIVGLMMNGIITERFGYRKTLLAALVTLAAFIFLSFFAYNIQTLLAGQVLCGLSWGVISTLTTTYAAEVMPLTLRAYLTANTNLCWLVGQIVAQGTLRGLIYLHSHWSYRIPFGVQWAWLVLIFGGVLFAPESPWWLIRKRRVEDAKRVLLRLTRRGLDFNADNTAAMMLETDIAEKKLSRGRRNDLGYLECFRGSNLRRTEIACATFMMQNLCGLPVIGSAAYLYEQIGFNEKTRYDLTIGMQAVSILAAFFGIALMKFFGRRILYLVGLGVQFFVLVAAGAVASIEQTNNALWGQAGLIILFIFVFDCTVGPLTYCLVAEMGSSRLRIKTVILARVSFNLCCLVTNVLQNHMLNPLAWGWRGKSCFFWAGSCFLCWVYTYFRLPETKGLTYLELDVLFEKRASAKKFKTFQQTLASTGYFSFYDNGSEEAKWG